MLGRMVLLPALQAVVDLALPRSCGGCGVQGTSWCAACAAQIERCAADAAHRVRPLPQPEGFPPTFAQTAYDGAVAAALRAHKDAGRADLTAPLASLLRPSLAAVLTSVALPPAATRAPVVLVPMPSRAGSVRQRGRRPLVEIARRAAGPAPTLATVDLLRVRDGPDQVGLDAAQRADNVRATMRPARSAQRLVPGAVCILVDDIVTTGATLTEAARVLWACGAQAVAAATIAATVRRRGVQPFTHDGG